MPDVQLAAAEIDVFHAQTQALHQPHTAAVEQIGNQPVDAVEVAKQAPDFCAAQDHGQIFRAFRAPYAIEPGQFLLEDFAVQKQNGGEGLVLRGRGDASVCGEPGEEGFDLVFA